MPKKETGEISTELLRHQLGSINLSDIEEKELSEQERKDYNAAIFAVWPRLEKDLKKWMYDQLMFSSNEAVNWDQVLFGRGSFNGLALAFENWKQAAGAHTPSKEEPFDEHSPISEI